MSYANGGLIPSRLDATHFEKLVICWKRDAAGNLAIHEEMPHAKMRVAKWKSILVEGSRNAGLVTVLGGSRVMEFFEVGDFFVRQILQIPSDHQMARSPRYLMERAEVYILKTPPQEKLDRLCEKLGPSMGAELKQAA